MSHRQHSAAEALEPLPRDFSLPEDPLEAAEVEDLADEQVEPVEPIPGVIPLRPGTKSAVAKVADPALRNFLGMYFREMATLSVFKPEQEFIKSREIEDLEVDLWKTLLAFPPAIELVLRATEHTMGDTLRELGTVRERARRCGSRPSRLQLQRLALLTGRLAVRLRALDLDRLFVAAAMDEVERAASGEPPRFSGQKLTFSPRTVAFRRWVTDVRTARERVQRAKNAFVKANLRLVVSIARRFNYGRMPFADLIQEGNIGLIKAVDRYDYRRGFRFSTYASWWIRHAISRALADKGRAVRLPVHMIDTYHRVAKATRELSHRLGHTPTSEEIGLEAGIEAEKVEQMKTFLTEESYSLDRTLSDDDERKFVDFLAEPAGTPTVTDRLSTQALAEEVLRLMRGLKPIEADILRQRFGLGTDEEMTLKQIGDRYHLSRERIRQLQEQALTKVRRALEQRDML